MYLETARNPFGFIGGIDAHCFDERYLRQQIREVAPERANEARPFRPAIIQLGTYDGTIYNARRGRQDWPPVRLHPVRLRTGGL